MRIATGLAALGLGALIFGAGIATADPEPAPVTVDAPSPPVDPFAAASAQTKDNPVDLLAGLLTGGPQTTPTDMLARGLGSIGLSAPPPADPLGAALSLAAQNYRMPGDDAMSPYLLQTGVPPGPFARVDGLKGIHALVHGGLGRMPGGELGQPLPGIAPPPGTNLPPGLEQFYIDPLLPPPPPAG